MARLHWDSALISIGSSLLRGLVVRAYIYREVLQGDTPILGYISTGASLIRDDPVCAVLDGIRSRRRVGLD
jgi:hypothetical protein